MYINHLFKITECLYSTGERLTQKEINSDVYDKIKRRGLLRCIECQEAIIVVRRIDEQDNTSYYLKHKPKPGGNNSCSLYTGASNTPYSRYPGEDAIVLNLINISQSNELQTQWFDRGFDFLIKSCKKDTQFQDFTHKNRQISIRFINAVKAWVTKDCSLFFLDQSFRYKRHFLFTKMLLSDLYFIKKFVILSFLCVGPKIKHKAQLMKYELTTSVLDNLSKKDFLDVISRSEYLLFFKILKLLILKFPYMHACNLENEKGLGEIYLLRDTSYRENFLKIGKTKNINNLIREYSTRRVPNGIEILDSFISDNWRSDEREIREKFSLLVKGTIIKNNTTGINSEWVQLPEDFGMNPIDFFIKAVQETVE